MNISTLSEKFGRPKGIIHVSPQFFFMRNAYLNLSISNIVWIESNPFFYELGLKIIETDFEFLYNNNIGSMNVGMNLSVDGGENTFHLIESLSLSTLINNNKLDINNYDYLYIGRQVSNLELDLFDLDSFKYITIETTTLKKDSTYYSKSVKNYMKEKRFKLVNQDLNSNFLLLTFLKKRKYNKK
jgi:hypothetical protein